jgi:hypothetical protein
MTSTSASLPYPVRVYGQLDKLVSRWLWLVKWLYLCVDGSHVGQGGLMRDPYLYTDDGDSRAVRRYQSREAQRSGFVLVYSPRAVSWRC